jgi:uncharacterized protein (TIGR03435 family)
MVYRKGSGIHLPRNTGGPGTDDPGRIHYPLITLKELLRRAWDSYYEIDGPGWLDSQAVAVEATMPPDTTKEQFKKMLRNLITDRFGLNYHTERKEAAGYTLSLSKNGSKMTIAPTRQDEPDRTGAYITAMSASLCRVVGRQATMHQLVNLLPFLLRDTGPSASPVTVTDSTGLKEKYDFMLEFSPRLAPPGTASEAAETLNSILSAVQSQLGLKLERKKVPVEVMVIDHMEKTPTEN